MTSSMHHDLQRCRRSEIRWLSGGVVHLGSAVGVATPLNRAIADILTRYEAGAPATLQTKTMESSVRFDRVAAGRDVMIAMIEGIVVSKESCAQQRRSPRWPHCFA